MIMLRDTCGCITFLISSSLVCVKLNQVVVDARTIGNSRAKGDSPLSPVSLLCHFRVSKLAQRRYVLSVLERCGRSVHSHDVVSQTRWTQNFNLDRDELIGRSCSNPSKPSNPRSSIGAHLQESPIGWSRSGATPCSVTFHSHSVPWTRGRMISVSPSKKSNFSATLPLPRSCSSVPVDLKCGLMDRCQGSATRTSQRSTLSSRSEL